MKKFCVALAMLVAILFVTVATVVVYVRTHTTPPTEHNSKSADKFGDDVSDAILKSFVRGFGAEPQTQK